MVQPIDMTSLKAYWKFDESSGNLINQAGNIPNNSSLGSGVDGLNNSISYRQTGQINKSYGYNGSSSYTDLQSVSLFNFMHNSSTMAWTVNIWYKRSDTTDGNYDILNDSDINPANVGILIRITTSFRLQFALDLGGTEPAYTSSNNFVPNDTNWHMITLRVDYSLSSNNVVFQIDNGTKSQFNKTGTSTASNSSFSMKLGRAGSSSIQFFPGNFDEFSLWNKYLTDSDISLLWNNGIGIDLLVIPIDGLSIVESVTKIIAKSISDSISLAGETINKSINKTISDTLSISDSTHVSRIVQSISDDILITDTVSISKNIIRSVVDNLVVGDIISKSLGKQINDSPSLSDVLSKNINKILKDNLSLVDIISKNITKLIVENPSFLDSTGQSKTLVRQITDTLSLLESTVISKQITEQIIDNLSSGDSISKNIGKLLQDNPTLAEQLSKAINKIITDNISIPDSVTKNIGSLLLNQTRKINLNNTTQQIIAEGKPRNVTI